jgi:hypothetical protein
MRHPAELTDEELWSVHDKAHDKALPDRSTLYRIIASAATAKARKWQRERDAEIAKNVMAFFSCTKDAHGVPEAILRDGEAT